MFRSLIKSKLSLEVPFFNASISRYDQGFVVSRQMKPHRETARASAIVPLLSRASATRYVAFFLSADTGVRNNTCLARQVRVRSWVV